MQNVTLKVTELKALLRQRLLWQIQEPTIQRRTIFIQGPRGNGKSEIVRQVAREVGKELGEDIPVITLTCSTMEPPDFNGLGYVSKGVTCFARPAFLPTEGKWVLFLDEANRPFQDIQNAMLTLIQDREINGHKLSAECMIVAAGNPMGSAAGAESYNTQEFDPALRDRFAFVDLIGNSNETINYLDGKYPGHFMVKFLKDNPDFIAFDTKGTTSPRSIEYAIKATLGLDASNDEAVFKALAVELGVNPALTVSNYLKEKFKLLDLETILTNKKKTVKYIKDNKNQPEAVSHASRILMDEIARRFDKNTRDDDKNDKYQFTDDERWNIAAFIDALDSEQFVAFGTYIQPKDEWDFNLEFTFFRHFIVDRPSKKVMAPSVYDKLEKIVSQQMPELKEELKKANISLYYK